MLIHPGKFIIHEQSVFDKKKKFMTQIILATYLNPDLPTAIHRTPKTIYDIKNVLKETFLSTKFIHTKLTSLDVTKSEEKKSVIEKEHTRAHRKFY